MLCHIHGMKISVKSRLFLYTQVVQICHQNLLSHDRKLRWYSITHTSTGLPVKQGWGTHQLGSCLGLKGCMGLGLWQHGMMVNLDILQVVSRKCIVLISTCLCRDILILPKPWCTRGQIETVSYCSACELPIIFILYIICRSRMPENVTSISNSRMSVENGMTEQHMLLDMSAENGKGLFVTPTAI